MTHASTHKKKIVVGMSGGVDSSVTAALLLEQGHEVIGAFMKNWSDTKDPKTGECAWRQEQQDAMRVAADLGISFMTFDFEKEYRESVVEYLFREYEAGRTPNPDVMCNRAVKFDLFLKEALKLGADAIATGHYARVKERNGTFHLLAGIDHTKDQSYFIFSLGQEQLKHILFPIGAMKKKDVRTYAKEHNLSTADKKDSQGICFIGKVELKSFLAKGFKPKPGPIMTVEGETIGQHQSIAAFTIGQRHGLGIGGGDPYFVVEKRIPSATLVVAKGLRHPALFSSSLQAGEWTWTLDRPPEFPLQCQARIRYRQPLQSCRVQPANAEGLHEILFDEPQRAITPGQFVVLYDKEEVIGGGVIQ